MKIIIQQQNTKFINNLDSLKTHEIIAVEIDSNIYQIDQKINPDVYVLIAEKITNEEIHFCQYNKNRKIIIYNSSVENLKVPDHVIVLNKIDLPSLYNPDRFINDNSTKDIECSYFLDNDKNIPKELLSELLPNKINTIKLFNNALVKHPQNLGYLSEKDKAHILNRSQKYICNNMFYALEAHLCGCEIYDINLNPINVNTEQAETYSNFFESIL